MFVNKVGGRKKDVLFEDAFSIENIAEILSGLKIKDFDAEGVFNYLKSLNVSVSRSSLIRFIRKKLNLEGIETEKRYWVSRGYTNDESTDIVSKIQTSRSKIASEKNKNNDSRTVTQYRYWLKQYNPATNTYYTEIEAREKVSKLQTDRGNVIKELCTDPIFLETFSRYRMGYWLNRGFSENEAIVLIKKAKEDFQKFNNATVSFWVTQINPDTNAFYRVSEAKEKIYSIQQGKGKIFGELCKDREWVKNHNPHYAEYWLGKGYSPMESRELADKKIQFSSESMKRIRENNPSMNLTGKSCMSNDFIDSLKWDYQLENEVCYGGHNSKEWVIFLNKDEQQILNKKFISVDFRMNNLIIEIYGDYWHCNPKFYDADDTPITFFPGKTSKEFWDYDYKRKQILENRGYTVIEVWEHQIKHEKQNILNMLSEKLNEHRTCN